MDRPILPSRFWSYACGNQFAALASLAVSFAFLVLTLYSYTVLEENTSSYAITQVNLILLSLFIPTLIYILYVCNKE